MPRVRLIHWKPDEAEAQVAKLRKAGYEIDAMPFDGPPALKALRRNPPDAVIIDLSRMPSAGRDVAAAMRSAKSTQHVPLVFVEGEPAKVDRVRSLLPDATYTTWTRIRGALRRAIANPPQAPVKTESVMAGYSGTPLPKKLGIKAGFTIALVNAPADFDRTLGPLPEGATLRRQLRGNFDLLLWFVKSRKELERNIRRFADAAPSGGTWIAWPKKASGFSTDVTQTHVRNTGLSNGLVDYKICAIDATWTGLKFAPRKR